MIFDQRGRPSFKVYWRALVPNACRPVTWDGAEQRRVALFRFFPVCCSPPLTVGNIPISVASSPNLRFLTFASVSFSPWRLKLRGSARAKNQWVGKHNVFPPRTTRTTPTSTRGSLYSEHLAQRSKRSSRRFVNQTGPHTKAAILLLRGSSVVPSKPPACTVLGALSPRPSALRHQRDSLFFVRHIRRRCT